MVIETNVNGDIVLKRIFNGLRLITEDNDQMILCMRDTGFEFKYGDVWYEAKEGKVSLLGAKNTEQQLQPDASRRLSKC